MLGEAAAILFGVLAAAATYWLILPATPQVRARLLARHIAQLTLRVGQSRTGADAAGAQRSVRAALIQLSNFIDSGSDLFIAAQNCLAEGRRALLRWGKPGGANLALVSTSPATENALRRASAALNVSIEPARREPS